jgi:hypothetical protein
VAQELSVWSRGAHHPLRHLRHLSFAPLFNGATLSRLSNRSLHRCSAKFCEQVVLFVAAVVVWGSLAAQGPMSQRGPLAALWAFGFCSLAFGLGHLTNIETVVPMVPK